MFAPGVPQVIQDFHTDNVALATFVVSVYILGFAMGPLVIAPASECKHRSKATLAALRRADHSTPVKVYGRLYVYHICNVGFIAFTLACAWAQNMNQLIAFRFLAGCLGVAPITNGGGTIADLMEPRQRGGAMAIWAMGPVRFCGPNFTQKSSLTMLSFSFSCWALSLDLSRVASSHKPKAGDGYSGCLPSRWEL